MDVKKDILWRVYLSYIIIIVVCMVIIGKAFYIQNVEGKRWRALSDSLHVKMIDEEPQRGTIYSEDGQMLSTSIPQFDIYIDFAAEGLREKKGQRFRDNLDSLSWSLSGLFRDKTKDEYKELLNNGYKRKDRYFSLKKKISFKEYQQMEKFPLVKLGRNKSGFIAEVRSIRLNPYQMLAYRTIGLDRENAQKIGLELTYDSLLKGTPGKKIVRYIAGGVAIPVEGGTTVEPQNGKDIITTLNMHMQEITENALMKMMVSNEAEHGCAIVMEVKTGKIKAIANLGRNRDGSVTENYNWALSATEPGSTFKLATLIAALEDKKVSLNNVVNLEGGSWQVGGRTVWDSEQHGLHEVTIKTAFAVSSNVAMAKLAVNGYGNAPSQFIRHLKQLNLDTTTGVDLYGERRPVIYKPGTKYWSNTTLPWMAFGYNLLVTPMHTAMLYNAVANGGKMVKPYLVGSIMQDGRVIQDVQPTVLNPEICSKETLKQLHECLLGATTLQGSTGFALFKNSPYRVAGKTGTALVANGNRGYADKIYQSSFAGFFPAEDPQYTIVVVIKNKPHAAKFYGAAVAGPVWKEIADRLYTLYVKQGDRQQYASKADSVAFSYAATGEDVRAVFNKLNVSYSGSINNDGVTSVIHQSGKANVTSISVSKKQMPSLKGMGLKDVLDVCENMGLKVVIKGKGKVVAQSIIEGTQIATGQLINIEFR